MAGRYGKCLTRGPEPLDGDHWDNDIITAILILLGHTIIIRHPLRADALNPRRIMGIYFLACPGRAVAFCRTVTKYDDPAETGLMKSSGRARSSVARVNID